MFSLLLSIQFGIAPEIELFVRNLHQLFHLGGQHEFEINHWKCKYFGLQIAEV